MSEEGTMSNGEPRLTTPNSEQLEGWKKKGKVFRASMQGYEIYYKLLSRDAYYQIAAQQMVAQQQGKNFDFELAVLLSCVLNKIGNPFDELAEEIPGLVTSLSDRIMARSGFTGVESDDEV